MTPFEIVDFARIKPFACPFGESRRAFVESGVCSVHAIEVRGESITHYHKRLTETYYFLEGRGSVELDGVAHAVAPGMAVQIHPGTRHRVVSAGGPVKFLNIVVPPYDPKDEWIR